MTTYPSPNTVSVLGTGNMGAAIVRALLTSGRRVVAWNRTPERAHALVADGALLAPTAAEAVRASELTIICVSTTDAAQTALDGIALEDFADRTVLNLTTGTPDDAHALTGWAADCGVRYLDGSIGAYPEQIGGDDTLITVSGEETLWLKHRDTILALAGRSMHVGDDPAAANIIDAGLTGAFYMSSLVSFVEAVRYMNGAGVSNDAIAGLVDYTTAVLAHQMLAALREIDADDFDTDQATIDVFAHTSAAFAEAISAGSDATMINATASTFRRAADAGLGEKALAALHTLASN
ncbi:NAD(P)-dependent oxidoreductase [Gordonia sp. PDNC005]|uniref:NAD(P)-dependent oxidoreductase n=1 Tax=unclassified Gordonia (in: high G+C Gram-positive bacteria) TaxID=2657482 RepID=UPI00196353EF|nr:NAD(P)-binding domain-containing protein [Gordonia sp. PDNC005]QRY62141.1 NAD(P)-dependent oxidoreductase [Gordonia sp. PDNC005]